MENTLSGCTAQVVDGAQYDSYAKNMLSNRYILAWILKETAAEFSELPIEQIALECIDPEIAVSEREFRPENIIGDDTENNISGEGKIICDLRFHAYTPQESGRKKYFFDVEAQKNFYPGYEIVTRGIFYGARMISIQAKTEFDFRNYDGIKKVYSIWICMNAPDKVGSAISRFAIAKTDVRAGIPDNPPSYDKLTVIQITLGRKVELGAKSITGLLSIMFTEGIPASERERIMEEEFGVILNDKQREGFDKMCNFSEGIFERGIEQGEARRLTKNVESVMRSLKVSLEKACEVLEVTMEQYQEAQGHLF